MPRYIIGAVSMKMRSSTRTTSTKGMMLISASELPMRWPSPPPTSSSLNAIFGRAPQLRRTAEHVQEIEREAVHLGRPVLHAIHEVVVRHDGGDGGGEAGGRCDQRLRDTGRDDGEAGRPLLSDAVEGRHDAPHRAEEADEGRGTRRRGEEGQVAL